MTLSELLKPDRDRARPLVPILSVDLDTVNYVRDGFPERKILPIKCAPEFGFPEGHIHTAPTCRRESLKKYNEAVDAFLVGSGTSRDAGTILSGSALSVVSNDKTPVKELLKKICQC